MGARKWRNLLIRGVVYPTAGDAAAALGISSDAVLIAARAGQEALDRCGLRLHHPRPLPVRVGGVVYPDARSAAAALNVRLGTLRSAILAGDPDRVLRDWPPCMVRARPVRVAGLSFPSHSALDRWLGCRPGYSAAVMKKGGEVARSRLAEKVMARIIGTSREAA